MKTHTTTKQLIGMLSVILLLAAGCSDGNNSPNPQISGIQPESGPPGTAVTINGSGFSPEASQNTVRFGSTAAPVNSATTSRITTEVPEDSQTGAVSVTVGSVTASGPSFTVEPEAPGISAVEPDSGVVGTEVTITGMNFSANAAENTVTFNGTPAQLSSASETQLVAVVPKGVESGPIEVTVGGQTATGPDFTYILTVTVSTLISDTDANLSQPRGLTVTTSGELFVADANGPHTIRKITTDREVSIVAGGSSGFKDGTGADAAFDNPSDVAVDNEGVLYVADAGNGAVRQVSPEGEVNTLAGDGTIDGDSNGTGSDARFSDIRGVAVSDDGRIYVTDIRNNKVKVVTQEGEVTTLVGGDGQFGAPFRATVGSEGMLYVVVGGNIMSVDPNSGEANTVFEAGDIEPCDIAVDVDGMLYVTDMDGNQVHRVSQEGDVRTIAGDGMVGSRDGSGSEARFNEPFGITIDPDGNLYISELGNDQIRKIIIE